MKQSAFFLSLFHLLVSLHFWIACYYDWNFVKIPAEKNFERTFAGKAGKLKFLTYWNALLQGSFFLLCFLCDMVTYSVQSPKNHSYLTQLKTVVFTTLSFPLSMFVGFTFWGIYIVDRELIFPTFLDEYIPSWLNHAMHTNIVIFSLIEVVTSFRRYPKRQKGIIGLTIFMAIYLIWIHIIYYSSNFWVYPILDALYAPLRILFFAVMLGLSTSLYILGEKINNFVWFKQLNRVDKVH